MYLGPRILARDNLPYNGIGVSALYDMVRRLGFYIETYTNAMHALFFVIPSSKHTRSRYMLLSIALPRRRYGYLSFV